MRQLEATSTKALETGHSIRQHSSDDALTPVERVPEGDYMHAQSRLEFRQLYRYQLMP